MKRILLIPVLASILILGTLGFSQNVLAIKTCDLPSTVGGGALGDSPGPIAPLASVLGWNVGSGQCNGSFSSVTDPAFPGGALELALRAEERRVGQVIPSGVNDYTVMIGYDANIPPRIDRAWWNFQGSVAYNGVISDLDSLTLTIRTDVGPNLPSSPIFDLQAAKPLISARNPATPSTSGFSDIYQFSQSPEFSWFISPGDSDLFRNGIFDYSVPGAWLFTLTAVEGASTSSVSICIHTPGQMCDTTAPIVTVSDETAEATSQSGASVSFTATAEDDIDGPITPTCTHDSGDIFPLGDTTVTCTATDAAGNVGIGTGIITVEDTTAPIVTVPNDILQYTNSPSGATVTYSGESATDIVDGPVLTSCTPSSGSTFPVGLTIVQCTATDAAGNSADSFFDIFVEIELFCGLPETSYNKITGTLGNDNLKGTNGDDLILGLEGNDKINGKKGNDCIIGGSGNDKINGGEGNDNISGGLGNDKIDGHQGDDTITGDDGNDKLHGGHGNDAIDGGADNDKCHGGQGTNTITNCEDTKSKMTEKDDSDEGSEED